MIGNGTTATSMCYVHGFSDLCMASHSVTNPFASFPGSISDDQDESEDNQARQLSMIGSSTSSRSTRCSARHLPRPMGGRAPASAAAGERGHLRLIVGVAPRSTTEFAWLTCNPRRGATVRRRFGRAAAGARSGLLCEQPSSMRRAAPAQRHQ